MKRVIFFGMGGAITDAAFWTLYRDGMLDKRQNEEIQIVGVIKPFPYHEQNKPRFRLHRRKWWKKTIPRRTRLNTLSMCEILPSLGIDVLEVSDVNQPKVLSWVKKKKPDLLCVAAFPMLFSKELLSLSPNGCVNLHPSLLPYYRGINPLFWMFKEGAKEAGASIHFLDTGIDSGDLIAQQSINIPYGITGRELMQKIADVGAPMLLQAIRDIFAGSVQSSPQHIDLGTLHHRPTSEDLHIDSSESFRSVYHFANGVARWMPLVYELDEHLFVIQDVIDHSEDSIPGEFLFFKGILTVSCSGGVVRFRAECR